jgi:3-isopropylmalate/(R)-2-methylmalate dehydratase small subunit
VEPLKRIDGVAVALPLANVDTDQLLPARFLKVSRASGLGQFLFHDLRFEADGRERPNFPLNTPDARDARILVARKGFGVGSSREAAVYALVDFGIRCVIAPTFGDIFTGNATNNGLLTAIVTEEDAEALISAVQRTGRAVVDLAQCRISSGDLLLSFQIDATRQTRLLNGWDDIDLTRSHQADIDRFVASDRVTRPWAQPRQ